MKSQLPKILNFKNHKFVSVNSFFLRNSKKKMFTYSLVSKERIKLK